MDILTTFFSALLDLWLDAAFWLILGLVIAGILQATLNSEKLGSHLAGNGIWPAVKAAVLGMPLPLCSCGVIPAAVGLRRAGASKSATTAFLISTPETGVDSISISYALLGPFMAIIRVIAALTSAVSAALLVLFTDRENTYADNQDANNQSKGCNENVPTSASCQCSVNENSSSNKSKAEIKPLHKDAKQDNALQPITTQPNILVSGALLSSQLKSNKLKSSELKINAIAGSAINSASKIEGDIENRQHVGCCSSSSSESLSSGSSGCCGTTQVKTDTNGKHTSLITRLWQGQVYAFTDLIKSLSLWLIVGLVISALVVTFVPSEALAEISRGPLAMFVMALIGVPMYICASASTPLAAGLLLAGVSPGAVLVFLLAGPATNMATLGIVHKELGIRALVSYLFGVVGVAILFGYLTNFLVDIFAIDISAELASSNMLIPHSISWGAGIALMLIIGNDLWKRFSRSSEPTTSCCSG